MRYLNWFGRSSFVLVVAALAVAACTAAEDRVKTDVIFWPTPVATMNKMLEIAKLSEKDILYDLGCGDGRIVCAAAKKFKCKAYGYDIDPERIKECEANKAKLDKDIQKLVTFKKQNIFDADFDISEASVVTLYLLPDLNVKLIPKLEKLKKGSRIVSHQFDMKGVTPEKGYPINIKAKKDKGEDTDCDIYLWTTPLKIEKNKD